LLSVHDLEIKRQLGLHKTDLVHRDEEVRLLKLKALSLRDENARLEEAAGSKGIESQELLKSLAALRQELHEAHRAARGQEARFKKQNNAITALKVRLPGVTYECWLC
jgi:chromosome segregation ATPase